MNIKEMQNDYDWQEAFSYFNCDINKVQKIIAYDNGENDSQDWIGIFQREDGKYIYGEAGCDYTGWDCQAGGHSETFDTLEKALSKISLPEETRTRLKDQLSEYKLDWD